MNKHRIIFLVIPVLCIISVAGVIFGIRFSNIPVSSPESRSDHPTKFSQGDKLNISINNGLSISEENSSQNGNVISGNGTSSEITQTAVLPNANRKTAYLTFDDGPSKLTPELLNTLKDCQVQATFFIIGLNAEQYPGTLKEIVNYGDVIGVHSWTHRYSYIYQNTHNFLDDFNELKDYIKQETGVTPNVCRFPGGTNNTVCFQYNKDHIMKKIVPLVEGMGFKYYDWNVSSGEAATFPPTKAAIVNNVISQCKNKKSAVILFHDTDHQCYVDAIPEIITELRDMGFSFETLSPNSLSGANSTAVQFKPS